MATVKNASVQKSKDAFVNSLYDGGCFLSVSNLALAILLYWSSFGMVAFMVAMVFSTTNSRSGSKSTLK